MPSRDPSQANRIHPLVIWSAALIVVAAVAAGAWLGVRRSAMFSSAPEAETTAAADTATPVQQPTQKPRSGGSQTAVRPVTRGETAIAAPDGRAERSSEEALGVAPVGQAADLIARTTPIEVASDPILAASIPALPEDNHVYSSEAGGVVAPRLTSLGFVHRLVSGLRVRTSTIELVIAKNGTVERANIYSRPAHWEDALLLSRAKMFRFIPAYRNGFPVRYRFVMDVDTSP